MPQGTPASWFTSVYIQEEISKKQLNCRFYNAREFDGILSVCLLCYDLPVRMTLGNEPEMKQYEVHNGAWGRIKNWTLPPDDVKKIRKQ